MLSEVSPDPASFRDPSGYILRMDGRIFRTVTEYAAVDFEFVRSSGLYESLVTGGQAIAAEIVDDSLRQQVDPGARYLLEHPKLPIISYPFEWSFPQLKAAALLHLDIQIQALKAGVTLSDACAYNIQFIGARPIFIDTLSFRRYRSGEYWLGHRQFCEQFLMPLLLRAYFGTSHNNWYRGALEGIPRADFVRLLPLYRKLSWNTLIQLVLPNFFDRSAQKGHITDGSETLQKAGFPSAAFERLLKRLRRWIAGLEPRDRRTATTWQDYATQHSYEPEQVEAKRAFVAAFVSAEKPQLLWDLGCNTGDYSELALKNGAGYVVGWDFDQGAIEAAFQRAVERDLGLTPLYLDAANPTPDQGWAQEERLGMQARASAEAVLALAFVHHLAIARNLPLSKIALWLTGLGRTGVVEFVAKEDRMVQTMLQMREDIFPDYKLETFIDCLSKSAQIEAVESIGTRHLIRYRSFD